MRGSPERGYFVPACVGSGRWADFERCSRIHACGFRCLEGKTSKTLNKYFFLARTPLKTLCFFNKSYSHGSKLAVFTTFFKVFVRKVRFCLMFLRFRLLSGGKTLKTLNKSILLARTPLKTCGFLITVAPTARN